MERLSSDQEADRHLRHASFERTLLLLGRIAALQVQQKQTIRHLGDVEFRVTSQWGEDGIIEWLCHKLPSLPRSFVEFGVENYSEANTRFLLQNRGWTGIVMDADPAHMNSLQQHEIYWRYDLTAIPAFVSIENINDLISQNGMSGDVGILSIDIDGNDYWVLKAITIINPSILICESNGTFGDLRSISIPYINDFYRFDSHYSGDYFGCSIKALIDLCKKRGYTFIGTNTAGLNAFFVRDDLAPSILRSIEEVKIWPHRHRDSRDQTGKLVFRRDLEKLSAIQDMPVVDLETEKTVRLKDLFPLHSEAYLHTY